MAGAGEPEHIERATAADPVADEAELASDLDRIVTIPNLITLVRLLCLPVYWWLLFGRNNKTAAAAMLAALGATDWIDGYVARRYHQVSNLGKVLDPTVDRLLFFVGIVGIILSDSAPLWVCLVVLVREVTTATITVVITLMGAKPVRVTWYGKAQTFLLMFAFPLFLAGSGDLPIHEWFTIAAWLCAIPGMILSYYAFFLYVPMWRANLREARAERGAARAGT